MSKLIICIDGLGKDLVSKEDTPFLYKFGKENYFSELETLFAFTGLEYSFFSGKSPLEHRIWLEFARSKDSIFKNLILKFLSFNKKLRDYFGVFLQKLNGRTWFSGLHNIPADKLKYFDTSVKTGLWKTDYFKSKDFVFYKWPFFVVKKNGVEKRKIVFSYESDEQRLNRLLSVKGSEIYYTQLLGVDKTIHKFGKKSFEAKQALKKMDRLIEISVKKFLKDNPGGDVYLWSDHGFADVKNYIDIEKILPKRNDYLYFIAGTTVHFWFGNSDVGTEVRKSLKEISSGEILNDKTAKKYKIPTDRKYGDLIFYVKKGNYFFPNFYQKSYKERFVAMHGYPDDKELNGFFISNEKINKKSLRMEEVVKFL